MSLSPSTAGPSKSVRKLSQPVSACNCGSADMSVGCRQQQDDRQLALLPTTSRQGDDGAGLSQEMGALRGLLARVAPQLEELVGVKQQMSHLLSVLQPGMVPKRLSVI